MPASAKNFTKTNLDIAEIKQDIKKFIKHVEYVGPYYNGILKEYFFNQECGNTDAVYIELQMLDDDKITVKKMLDMLKKYGLSKENYNISAPVDVIKDGKKCYIYTVYIYIQTNSKNVIHSFWMALIAEAGIKSYKEKLCGEYENLAKIISSE